MRSSQATETNPTQRYGADRNKPNIIILYADDLGYGDIGCYGASDVPTPNIDRLGSEGIRFTEGHSVSATCTPARYSLLTGAYPWRNENAAILSGNAALIIDKNMHTLPRMLQHEGYATGVVGKWHLGLGDGEIDWNNDVDYGPLDVGFDDAFIMPATNDRVPCVYMQDRRVVGLEPDDPIHVAFGRDCPFPGIPTGRTHPELLRLKYSHDHDGSIVNGISRIGYMTGGTAARWKDEEMAEVFLDKALSFISAHAENPFFLYYAFHQPHVPRVPGSRFAGTTKLGSRGDVIAEMDWCVGEVLKKLDDIGLRENTIIVFTSDNGPVLDDGYEDEAVLRNGEHTPAGPLRGGKYSKYEGGSRVPFLLSWLGTVHPAESSDLVCQVDMFASIANLVGHQLHRTSAPDSFNVLEALLGTGPSSRTELVTEGTKGNLLLRQRNWVFIPPNDGPTIFGEKNIETGNAPHPQLYDLNSDVGQRENMTSKYMSKVSDMAQRLTEIVDGSGTRPDW